MERTAFQRRTPAAVVCGTSFSTGGWRRLAILHLGLIYPHWYGTCVVGCTNTSRTQLNPNNLEEE
jgi:hypothetical protein